MQNIHVKRYQSPNSFQGSIEPADESWIVFIDNENRATFWRRVQVTTQEETAETGASTQYEYRNAELPALTE